MVFVHKCLRTLFEISTNVHHPALRHTYVGTFGSWPGWLAGCIIITKRDKREARENSADYLR